MISYQSKLHQQQLPRHMAVLVHLRLQSRQTPGSHNYKREFGRVLYERAQRQTSQTSRGCLHSAHGQTRLPRWIPKAAARLGGREMVTTGAVGALDRHSEAGSVCVACGRPLRHAPSHSVCAVTGHQ